MIVFRTDHFKKKNNLESIKCTFKNALNKTENESIFSNSPYWKKFLMQTLISKHNLERNSNIEQHVLFV